MTPVYFDLRHATVYPSSAPHTAFNSSRCEAFRPLIQQHSCKACVAASLATVLSIQACLALGRSDIAYSAQHIWDCYDGSCASGVRAPLIRTFFPYIASLAPRSGAVEHLTNSNYSACTSVSAQHLVGVQAHQALGNSSASVMAMRAHIHSVGPVMALARMTELVFRNFLRPYSPQQKQQQEAFAMGTHGGRYLSHALAVIGWRNTDGAWLVQNSMGPNWQDNGVGWVLGPLEAEWYGFQLDVQPPSFASATEPDLPFYYRARSNVAVESSLVAITLTCLGVACLLCFCIRPLPRAEPYVWPHAVCP